MNSNHLLIIDDERDVAEFIAEVGRHCGFNVVIALCREEVDAALESIDPLVIILDLHMPDCDGVEIMRLLAEMKYYNRILLISGMGEKIMHTVFQLGKEYRLNMLGALQKPIKLAELENLLEKALMVDEITSKMLEFAIEQGEIIVFYQPLVTLNSDHDNEICGVEALARWQKPGQGLILPNKFIPLAESSGLIAPLTNHILKTAVQQQSKWRKAGIDLIMSINLSSLLLNDLSLPDQIDSILQKLNTIPSRLKLEITESGAMQDPKQAMDILTRFRIKGIALSMDDFGTGYSSLVQLFRLPFSELKIDMSFILELEKNPEARLITETCINLASNLGLKTCAEGVETESTYRLLRNLGCTSAQGYYISRPIPADEFLDWVNRWQTMHSKNSMVS
ncbi:MAG: EAL domain-containing response regulator [Gammaproteobacteria bacterium]|nr:EAL domain-containing response regulator [Gammaproteobacteria bacterium]